MNILSIDTATDVCSVAITYDGQTEQLVSDERIGHSNLVLGLVSTLCQNMGISISQLDVMAVDIGPGSFTGVRIGIGVIQGLAYGANLPVLGVSSLEVLAASTSEGTILPALDARMGQIYCGLYDTSIDLVEVVAPIVCYPAKTRIVIGEEAVLGLGSGWDQYGLKMKEGLAEIQEKGSIANIRWEKGKYPEARFINKVASMKGMEFCVNPLDLRASYVRNQVVKSTGP